MARRKQSVPRLTNGGVTIEGEYPEINRVSTKLFSLDAALGGGLPTRSAVELFGYSNSCKSTLSYYLSGIVAGNNGGTIELGDFEGLSREYLSRAVSMAQPSAPIRVRIVPITEGTGKNVKPSSAENMLTVLRDRFSEEGSGAAILDSVSAIVPNSELEGEISDAVVGKRAQVVARFMRSMIMWLRNKERPANVFIVNHLFGIIGGRGSITAGGESVKNLPAVRIRLQPIEKEDDGSMVVGGSVEKLRFRSDESGPKQFKFFSRPGYGIHPGLSAVLDCIDQGKAKKDRTITMGNKSYGYWSKLVEQADDLDLFALFVEALRK